MAVLIRPYTVWKHLMIVCPNTAIPAVNGGAPVTMTTSELLWVKTVCDAFPGHIVTMSKGNASINQTVVTDPTVITNADALGSPSNYWLSQADVATILTNQNHLAYDSTTLFAPNAGINCLYGGLTDAPTGRGLPGYSFIPTAPNTVAAALTTYSIVHEWILQSQGWYILQGLTTSVGIENNAPWRNAAGVAYSTFPTDHDFLSDTMTGNVHDAAMSATRYGVPTSWWRSGRPVT